MKDRSKVFNIQWMRHSSSCHTEKRQQFEASWRAGRSALPIWARGRLLCFPDPQAEPQYLSLGLLFIHATLLFFRCTYFINYCRCECVGANVWVWVCMPECGFSQRLEGSVGGPRSWDYVLLWSGCLELNSDPQQEQDTLSSPARGLLKLSLSPGKC